MNRRKLVLNRRLLRVGMAAILAGILGWGAMSPHTGRVLAHPREFVADLLGFDPKCAKSGAAVRPEHPQVPGVPNFGQVTATLYRGGQPTDEGMRSLQRLGVQLVVNFREDEKEVAAERRAVEGLGMRYASIPWSARDDPDNRQVAEFLALLRDRPETKVFAHCKLGRDRTGVMIAAFRIACLNWTPEQAVEEMESFGFCGGLASSHHHLEKYVEELPEQLRSNPRFTRCGDDSSAAPARYGPR